MQPIRIVLVEPEIPPNTGNVGRTCVGLGLELVLVGKLGYSLDDRYLKRAGLDYWPKLRLLHLPDAAAALARVATWNPVLLSARAPTLIFDHDLRDCGALVFGSESRGLPAAWRALGANVRLPQNSQIRSFNLSAAVHSAATEWVRQTGWNPGP